MKALIFGASGQDGYYLRKICEALNFSVIAVSRSQGDWLQGDVSNKKFVEDIIKTNQPDYVFHLAAVSSTRHSALFENHEIISSGTLYILEAAYKYSPFSKIFITGSGLQFNNVGKPISEKDPFNATNAYSVSRIHSVFAARYYRDLGLKTYVGYLFHHESPLRKENHVSKMIANAVRRIAAGSNELIEIGDITVNKEWGFAADIADGIFHLVNQNKVYEACIGTGEAYSIEQWLATCFTKYDLKWQDHVKLKETFTAEYKYFLSDPSTMNTLGWRHKTSFEQLAEIMMG